MAKLDIALQMLREQFTLALEEAFAGRFGKRIETQWNIFHNTYVSQPPLNMSIGDPSKIGDTFEYEFTPDMIAFIAGFETAWLKATAIVGEER